MGAKSQEIQQFIIDEVDDHPRDIVRQTVERFEITRQAVNRHIKILTEDGVLEADGRTSERSYRLVKTKKDFTLLLVENQAEDLVYRKYLDPLFSDLKRSVQDVLYYGFTEMFNNVIDHSGGTVAMVSVVLTAKKCSVRIVDDGIGIFEKIKNHFDLYDHREAVLELCKGKLTTDRSRHSGQGIFFTSRMFDEFWIQANSLFFIHERNKDDWLIEADDEASSGTCIKMEIAANSAITTKDVFDSFTDPESDDYAFSKTHVPLRLAKYRDEELVSRSQAKRVLSRFDRFKEVLLDFKGVNSIGQAFADEIFRVYKASNPEVAVIAINTTSEVTHMINRAKSPDSTP